jgi:hypothetical protein
MEEINQKACHKCAKCCLSFQFWTNNADEALRFSWLKSNKISVERVAENEWAIVFKIPCKSLERTRQGYTCKVHEGSRPDFCKEYPLNFLSLDTPKENFIRELGRCPELKRIVNNGRKD